jgi:glycosyltransferase involved in cell wall biosynthesis
MPDVAHLLVDARPVEHPTARRRGIGRYVTGLIAGLCEVRAPFTALVDHDRQAATLAEAVPDVPLARWSPEVVRQAPNGTWYVATQLMLHPVPLDPIPGIVTDARLPVAAVMYDVIPHRYPERYLTDPFARRLAHVRTPLARTLDALLAISHFAADTAADELDFPRDRVAVIGAGVEDRFRPPDRPPNRPGDVVAVTGGDPRKNTEGLLRAWARVAPEVRRGRRLVVVAAHAPSVLSAWRDAATQAGLSEPDDVVFTGGITDEQLVALLQQAELSVMPSFEEGFGLPVLEAAACGVPAICSRVSSLPEVLDHPDAIFDPHDTGSMAAAITKALTDDEHRTTLAAAGRRAVERWQWRHVAQGTLDALTDLGPRWPQTRRTPPRRVALMTPGEQSPSGIGPYTARIAQAIDRRGTPEVERVIDTSGSPAGSGDRFPVRALGRSIATSRFDHLVAVLGSSHHHIATAQVVASLLERGDRVHLWLHEASLVGVHLGLAHASGSQDWANQYVAERLAASEPLNRQHPADALDAEALRRHGVTLLAELASRAASVVVSTEVAADTVRRAVRDVGRQAPPVLVLPLAFPHVTATGEPPPGCDVVSLGWLAPNKAPEVILDAFAAVPDLPDEARLVFAGPVQGDIVEQVHTLARARGVADRLVVTGHLDAAAYAATIAGARVGMQWRHGHQGEQSAAVNDLVAAGVPTITNLPSTGTLADLGRLATLMTDDDAWRHASAAAAAAALSWTADHVAEHLLAWLEHTAR